jgi:hypothetical protein
MIKLAELLREQEESTGPAALGHDPDEVSSDFPINWNAIDLAMLAKWDIATVRKFAGKDKKFKAIYPAILNVHDLDYKLVEEEPDEFNEPPSYDWDEFHMRKGGFPPIVVLHTQNKQLETLDGNHRLKWAHDNNYDTIGAWVVDEYLQKQVEGQGI